MIKITVYSPESGITHLGKLLRSMVNDFKDANALGLRLAKRNVKALYRQSFLGYFWSVIPPFMTAFVWIFLNKQNVVNIAITDIPYPLFVLTGAMLWQIFSESVLAPLKAVQSSASMLTKINFPRESLILSGIYEVIFNSFIKIGLILLIFAYFKFIPGVEFILAIIGIISIIVFGNMVGLLLTPFGMLYSDISRGLGVFLQFAIYLTPVIYPSPQSGVAAALMKFNPVAPLITTTRSFLLITPIHNLNSFIIISAASLILFFVGIIIYKIAMPIIIERIGS